MKIRQSHKVAILATAISFAIVLSGFIIGSLIRFTTATIGGPHEYKIDYQFSEVGRSPWTVEGEFLRLYEIKHKKTRKTYLVLYHDGVQAESMQKIDEWEDNPKER